MSIMEEIEACQAYHYAQFPIFFKRAGYMQMYLPRRFFDQNLMSRRIKNKNIVLYIPKET